MKEQPKNQASGASETTRFFVPGFRQRRVSQASYAQPQERGQTWPKEKTKERKKERKEAKERKEDKEKTIPGVITKPYARFEDVLHALGKWQRNEPI